MITDVLKAQLVTASILPLETYLTITNEELMPGLTKILQLEQEFEHFAWNPEDQTLWESNLSKIPHSWAFVYENKDN